MNVDHQIFYQRDLDQTRENRRRLQSNKNLLFWYQELYRDLFRNVTDIATKRVLEIGSGASPLKLFVPNVITTDILDLEHLDIVFDCQDIAELSELPDHSVDIITLTNVLHHLRDPMQFLRGATRKLAVGGEILIVEPFFSACSYPLYKLLHHEPVNFGVARPVLDAVDGPLSSSNQAIPHMIFFSKPHWLQELTGHYELDETRFGFFTFLAYMATGGISRVLPVPHWIYRALFPIDRWLAVAFPRLFASFFSVRLVARLRP